MRKSQSLGGLAKVYQMHSRTFRRHVEEVLQRYDLQGLRSNCILPPEVTEAIEKFMGQPDGRVPASRTMKELARDYEMPYETFRKRIRPISHLLKSKVRGKRIFSTRDILEIYQFLGEP